MPPDSLFDDDVGPLARVRRADVDDSLVRLGRQLDASVHLGTSSWSFPGWQGIVFGGAYSESMLAREGLAAYARHPLLRCVGIDRSFHQPLDGAGYARYAEEVPAGFRFVIKAPSRITDSVVRGEQGTPQRENPHFLDTTVAVESFVAPALEGLRERAGPLVFQLPPLPRDAIAGDAGPALIGRLGTFLDSLPRAVAGLRPVYAVELRNAELLTPRLVRTLRECGARLTIGIHARLPAAARQSAALRALDALADEGDDWRMKGPLVARWNLHSGFRYEDAKARYAPFDRLIDPDIVTRGALAHLVHVALKSGQPSYVIANNKAEGSAPLTLIELAKAIVD